jgi:hypothetical protein
MSVFAKATDIIKIDAAQIDAAMSASGPFELDEDL